MRMGNVANARAHVAAAGSREGSDCATMGAQNDHPPWRDLKGNRWLMFRKVAFTMYPITDVARARKFYEETLGLKHGLMGNQGDSYWIEYDLSDGGCLALSNFG